MSDDRGDDDRSSEDRPIGRPFADKEEDPNRVQKGLDEADYRRVERPGAARDAFDK